MTLDHALQALAALFLVAACILFGYSIGTSSERTAAAEAGALREEMARCELVAARAVRRLGTSQHSIWTWLHSAPRPKRGDLYRTEDR